MALSSTTHVGQTGVQTYLIGIAYLSGTYLHVYVDDVETTDFEITTDELSITITTPAIAGGEEIRIVRVTDVEDDERLVDWENSAAISERDLDRDTLQVLHLIQELQENPLSGQDGLPAGVHGGILTWDAAPDPVVISPGTSGFVLTTMGAGAQPVWAAAPGSGGGEANTASNSGTGSGLFAQKVGVDLTFKSLVAGTNITLSSSGTEVTITASSGGGGEANTASNAGPGSGWFAQKVGVDLTFKSAVAGNLITLTPLADRITVATTAEINTASNVGTSGVGPFDNKSASDLRFRKATGPAGGGVAVALNAGAQTVEFQLTSSGVTNEPAPTAGDLLYGFVGGVLRTFEIGDLPSSGGGDTLPVPDTTSIVHDPVTNTRQMRIDVGAVGIGITRVLTMPNLDINLLPDTGTFAAALHAARHLTGGADSIKIDDLAAGDDNTDLDSSTLRHGLLRKLSGTTTTYLDGTGAWTVPPGSGGGSGPPFPDNAPLVADSTVPTKLLIIDVGTIASSTTRTLTYPNQNVNLTPNTTFASLPIPVSAATNVFTDTTLGTRMMSINVTSITGGNTRVLKMPDQDVDLTPNTTFPTLPIPTSAATAIFKDTTLGTRHLAISVTGITGGQTRVLTMPDQNVDLTPNTTFASLPIPDATALIADSTVTTKLLRIDVGTISPSTTRVLTYPDSNIDLTPNTGSFPAATHASRHQDTGADPIKLDDLDTPDDNTDLNATASRHGLLPKLSGTTTTFLDGTGSFTAPLAAEIRKALSLAALRLVDVGLNTAPGSPSDGDAHVLGGSQAGATAWSGQAKDTIAVFRTSLAAWDFYAPADGQRGHVTSAATSALKNANVAYSALGTDWHTTDTIWITTEHWTGAFALNGTNEKIFAKCFVGDLLDQTAGSGTPGPNQQIAHGITGIDLVHDTTRVFGSISNGTTSVFIPQNFSSIAFGISVNATNITLTYASTNLSAYDFLVRIEYTK